MTNLCLAPLTTHSTLGILKPMTTTWQSPTTAMIEAAAHAICRRQEFSERNWRNYITDAKWALEAAFAIVSDDETNGR